MTLRVRHRTEYLYPGVVTSSHNELRLEPLDDEHQRCVSFRVSVTPRAVVARLREPGGPVHAFDLHTPHDRLIVEAESLVETRDANPFEGLNLLVNDWDWVDSGGSRAAWAEYLVASTYVAFPPSVQAVAHEARGNAPTVARFVLDLNRRLHRTFRYDGDVTHVHTRVDEVMELGAGVCQDFAHVAVAICRAAGIPARYVSGYLLTGGDGTMRGEQATHAWAEAALPDGRWLAFDPTNDLLANDRYVRAHWGLDYAECSPVRGIYTGPRAAELRVAVRVSREGEEAPLGAGQSQRIGETEVATDALSAVQAAQQQQ